MNALIEMFEAEPSSAYTPDEIVRRANDPFPTRLAVVVSGKVLESEGFIVGKEGSQGAGSRLVVPEGGLFGAIAALEGTWVAPDPLVAYVRFARSNGAEALDLAAFAARPRTARSGGTPTAVRREMERALAPAPAYRVKWAVTRTEAVRGGSGGGAGRRGSGRSARRRGTRRYRLGCAELAESPLGTRESSVLQRKSGPLPDGRPDPSLNCTPARRSLDRQEAFPCFDGSRSSRSPCR
jgi:hypothetical protein